LPRHSSPKGEVNSTSVFLPAIIANRSKIPIRTAHSLYSHQLKALDGSRSTNNSVLVIRYRPILTMLSFLGYFLTHLNYLVEEVHNVIQRNSLCLKHFNGWRKLHFYFKIIWDFARNQSKYIPYPLGHRRVGGRSRAQLRNIYITSYSRYHSLLAK
jgi:hypothetical protein